MSLKELLNEIDLNKRFPKYFTKWIIRTGFVICAILFLCAMWSNDWKPYAPEFKCLNESLNPCRNPFYFDPEDFGQGSFEFCLDYPSLCEKEYIQQGERIAVDPKFPVRALGPMMFLILVLTFIINHLVWRLKK